MIISVSAPDFVAQMAAAAAPMWRQLAKWTAAASANVTRTALTAWAHRLINYEREWSVLQSEASVGGGLPTAVVAEMRTITANPTLDIAAAAAAHTAAIATARNAMMTVLNLQDKRPAFTAAGDVADVVYTPAELAPLVGHLRVLRGTFLTYG